MKNPENPQPQRKIPIRKAAGKLLKKKLDVINGFRRRKEQSREKILGATEMLVNKYGLGKVSINDIAMQARVSPVTIYNLFSSKDQLVLELLTDIANKFIENVQEIIASDKPYFAKIEELVRVIVEINEANPGLESADAINNSELYQLESRFTDKIKNLFIDFIHQGQKEGFYNQDLSDDAISAYIEIFVRGTNANPKLHARTHHDPKLFHDLMLIMLYGISRIDGIPKDKPGLQI